MNNRQIIRVNSGQEGVRLDLWLTRQLTGISRSRIQQLIRAGLITINTLPVKDSHKTRKGEDIEIYIPPPRRVELKAENIPLKIVFEDDFLIVIDKPAGMVVHPAPGHAGGTLVNAILHHCSSLGGIGGELRPGIVHRLDKDTSGVIVVAKTEAAMAFLSGQFKRREIHKEYLAIVRGVVSPPNGLIETLIGRHATDRKKMAAGPKKGRLAITRYATLEKFEKYSSFFASLVRRGGKPCGPACNAMRSIAGRLPQGASLLRVCPETGRTHQIRVHLAHMSHPVIGDTKYGRSSSGELPVEIGRQMLHAHKISFMHPGTGKTTEFTVPMPDDMGKLLNVLRQEFSSQDSECRHKAKKHSDY